MSRKSNLKLDVIIIILLIFIFGQIAFGQDIIYVDSFAPLGGDGSDWMMAYKYLQDALADANTRPKPVEIWVAEGTYYPDEAEGIIPGDLDAFVVNYSGHADKVWLNDGSGTFVDSGQSLGSSDGLGVALGDLDGDGDLDAFVANYNNQADTVWLNDGTGLFIDSGQSLGSSNGFGVSLGDLDGDDDLDAFVANWSQANKVWLNDGSGNFIDSGQSLGNSDSTSVALGDLDGDDDLDAFVSNCCGDASKVWLNDGMGYFSDSGQSLSTSNAFYVALGNLDTDYDLDAFIANRFGGNEVWMNDGTGTFIDSGQSLGSSDSYGVALGYLDVDDDLDAFVANLLGYANKVFWNDGMGSFLDSGQTLSDSYSTSVALGDLDGDGDLDAYIANNGFGNEVWLNDGTGTFTNTGQSLGTSNSHCVALGDLDGDGLDSSGDPNATFRLINGVTIYGGFPSWGGFFEDRDPNIYITILNGDLLDNEPWLYLDDPSWLLIDPNLERADNSFHVVSAIGTEPNAVIDGFTITAGNARGLYPDNYGGGMYIEDGAATVRNCTFINNTASSSGGGMHSYGGADISNCIFSENASGGSGGGMTCDNDYGLETTLSNCIISGNYAFYSGGGMYEMAESVITQCKFIGNSSSSSGGGMLTHNTQPIIINCIFSGNKTTYSGGGMCNENDGEPTLKNCTFSKNSAQFYGAIYTNTDESASADLKNCIIWGNGSEPLGGGETCTYCCIEGGHDGEGNIDEDPLFADPDGPDDIAGTEDDNLHIASTSPCVDAGNNDINDANITADLDGNPRFTDNPIVDDTGLGSPPVIDMGAYEVQNIYVDYFAMGNMDGTSWPDAFMYLQDGLYKARNGGATIMVAEGTYTPDANMMGSSYGDANATFQLVNGVGVYGGFPTGGGDWENRDPDNYETILSGDLWYDDMNVNDPCDLLTEPTRAENSYHVVTCNDVNNAILNGFTITAGNANAVLSSNHYGGGMYCLTSNFTLAQCTFEKNSASIGGGMVIRDSDAVVSDCTFSRNAVSTVGGGLYNWSARPVITGCLFIANWVDGGMVDGGGGMYNQSSDLCLLNCTFYGNNIIGNGGGMYNYRSQADISNCIFSGNLVTNYGGGIFNWNVGDVNLTNCSFSLNDANEGGGIYSLDTSKKTLTNCIFWANTAADINGPQIALRDSNATISYSDIEGGQTGIYTQSSSIIWDMNSNIDMDPMFKEPFGLDFIPGTEDDDLRLLVDSPCINAGDPNADYSGQTDVYGQPRVIYGDVDMGAAEFAIIGDFDYSASVDFEDYADLVIAWLTGEGDELYDSMYDISEPPDGFIGHEDLEVFCIHWLETWPPMY